MSVRQHPTREARMADVRVGDSFSHKLAPSHHATLLTKHRLKDTVIKPSRLVAITTASLPSTIQDAQDA